MSAVVVFYADVPAEVAHVSAYRWQGGAPPVAIALSLARTGSNATITFEAASGMVVVQLQRADGGYLLDGPFAAPESTSLRRLDAVWRRSVEGHVAGARLEPAALEWVAEDASSGGGWPACWAKPPDGWECFGVPIDTAGVVFERKGERMMSAVVTGASTPVLRESAWGRLLIAGDRGVGPPPRLRVTAARPIAPTARRAGVRLETAVIGDVRVVAVAPHVVWLSGDSSPPSAWIEVRSARSGPCYLPLSDVAEGAPQVPVRVTLEDARAVDARIVSSGDSPAAASLVTTFRVIDGAGPRAAGAPPPRRVLVAETLADNEGNARIEGLGEADYEIVAWHPQFGRTAALLPAGAARVTLHLLSPGIARGRVLAGGKPVAGVDVISVPDPAAFAAADDPIDVKGGDARTAADGRFSLALAPGGGGELRVGGGAHPVKRIPLPRAPLPLVDVGDIELGRPLALSLVLDRDPGCDLRAAGPIGRSGLQIVLAARTGPGLFTLAVPEEGSWELGLVCGKEEREVTPAIVSISAGRGVQEVRLIVR